MALVSGSRPGHVGGKDVGTVAGPGLLEQVGLPGRVDVARQWPDGEEGMRCW